jgi:hypothetical protein
MMGYCSSPSGFMTFITKEINRMQPYSYYSEEDMLQHYITKYIERKLKYGSDLQLKGEKIIGEVRMFLKSLTVNR